MLTFKNALCTYLDTVFLDNRTNLELFNNFAQYTGFNKVLYTLEFFN